jgi:hypothetical protein
MIIASALQLMENVSYRTCGIFVQVSNFSELFKANGGISRMVRSLKAGK